MKLIGLVALTPEGLMGRAGTLPWRYPEDLAHFKRTTLDHPIVMGRLTWESLPGVLPRREHVVVSRSARELPGARVFPSLGEAIDALERDGREVAFLVGGAQLFREAFADERTIPDELIVTWVPTLPLEEGDVRFPFDPPRDWIEARYLETKRRAGEDGLVFVDYERRSTWP